MRINSNEFSVEILQYFEIRRNNEASEVYWLTINEARDINSDVRALSSAGRALRLHRRCQGFKSSSAHRAEIAKLVTHSINSGLTRF